MAKQIPDIPPDIQDRLGKTPAERKAELLARRQACLDAMTPQQRQKFQDRIDRINAVPVAKRRAFMQSTRLATTAKAIKARVEGGLPMRDVLELLDADEMAALEWLADQGKDKGPFCLFVHYDGPHTPFRLPDRFAAGFDSVAPEAVDLQVRRLLLPEAEKLDRRRNKTSMFKFIKDVNRGRRKLDPVTMQWIIDKYDAAVHYNDHAIGKLLDGLGELGLADDTIIAVLSDHGDEFLEHGGFSHGGIHLYEEIVRTVGLIFDPGSPGHGRHLEQPVSQVEMLPALLRLAGVGNAPSTGLGSLLENGSAPASPVFCHGKSKLAMREGDHKLIVPLPNPSLDVITRGKMWINMFLQRELRAEIFDLARDPGEIRNLASDKALRRRMQIRLRAHLAAPAPGPLGGDRLSADERERIEQEMKDLGYM